MVVGSQKPVAASFVHFVKSCPPAFSWHVRQFFTPGLPTAAADSGLRSWPIANFPSGVLNGLRFETSYFAEWQRRQSTEASAPAPVDPTPERWSPGWQLLQPVIFVFPSAFGGICFRSFTMSLPLQNV